MRPSNGCAAARGYWAGLAVLALESCFAAPAQNVLTQHFDKQRTGAVVGETILTPGKVQPGGFGKLFTRSVQGSIYAQPLYVSGLNISGIRNVVFVATMHNLVYAFDADDPGANAPLWGPVSLGTPVGLNDPNIGYQPFRDIFVEIGVMSTPVIDLDKQVLYAVAFTKESGVYAYHLHKLALTTGALLGSVEIAGTVAGESFEQCVADNGQIAFRPHLQGQRPGLLLDDGNLYLAFASFGDNGGYHGWVFNYDAATLQQQAVYNSSAQGGCQGGIWMSGQGIAADARHHVYLMTGNGSWNAAGATLLNAGDSFVKLSPDLDVIDWFTPCDHQCLNQTDGDLAAGGLLLIPGSELLAGAGKEGKLYLLNQNALGRFSMDDSGAAQTLCLGNDCGLCSDPNKGGAPSCGAYNPTTGFVNNRGAVRGTPVFWNSTLYVWPESSCNNSPPIKNLASAYQFNGATFNTTPIAQGSIACAPYPGGVLAISANGDDADSGILWATTAEQNSNQANAPGVLYALRASDLSTLWHSKLDPDDAYGNFSKFAPPVIANGKVYVVTIGALGFQDPPTTQPNPATLAVYGLK